MKTVHGITKGDSFRTHVLGLNGTGFHVPLAWLHQGSS